MVLRYSWLLLPFCCLSCQSLFRPQADVESVRAGQLWEDGQSAMHQGQVEEAIRCYERSLQADPKLVRNHLSLTAAYLEKGSGAEACTHLGRYVTAHPEHVAIRAHYAELLMRLRRLGAARAQFETFDADAQELGAPALRQRIHCHSRLMEIAAAAEDEYGEHLHRGIGLYLLACEREALPDLEEGIPTESLLCKAAGELTLARLERPEEARPCWYLYETWSHLGQRRPAQRWLHEADREAPFTYLTPAEQRGLHLACRQDLQELVRRDER